MITSNKSIPPAASKDYASEMRALAGGRSFFVETTVSTATGELLNCKLDDSNLSSTERQAIQDYLATQGQNVTLTVLKPATYIPLYNWNGNGYDRIIAQKQAHPAVEMVVAVNPASGPGTAKSTTLETRYKAMADAGVQVIGYVGVNYGSELTKRQYPVGNPWPSDTPKTEADIKTEMDRYRTWYNIRNYMFDDFPNNKTITMPDGSIKDVYVLMQRLAAYARSNGGTFVKGNAGTRPHEDYFMVCDNIAVVERDVTASGYPLEGTPTTVGSLRWATYDGKYRDRCTVVLHTNPTLDTTKVPLMVKYGRYLYSSDATYNQLPAYFEQMIAAIDSA